jgi:uncharacterized integral membrane protein
MKNYIVAFMYILLFFYLIGCFVEVSFDISKWKLSTRVIMAFLGSFGGLISIVVTTDLLNQNKKDE